MTQQPPVDVVRLLVPELLAHAEDIEMASVTAAHATFAERAPFVLLAASAQAAFSLLFQTILTQEDLVIVNSLSAEALPALLREVRASPTSPLAQ
jgi:DNA-binding transcriptional MocR family regulator